MGWGRKSHLGPAELNLFPTRVFAKAISITHSDILYRLDISVLFYERLLFQIFVLWKFLRT